MHIGHTHIYIYKVISLYSGVISFHSGVNIFSLNMWERGKLPDFDQIRSHILTSIWMPVWMSLRGWVLVLMDSTMAISMIKSQSTPEAGMGS